MNHDETPSTTPQLLDDESSFDLLSLCQSCGTEQATVTLLVAEGVLEPSGAQPQDWRFAAAALPRARRALRLQRDLDLDAPAVALVLDLLDRIEALESRLRRLGRS